MKNKKRIGARSVVVIVSVLALLFSAISITLAFIIDRTDPITNTFTPSEVTCEVIHSTENINNTKSFTVMNTGDTEAYIRAAIVVTWQREGADVDGDGKNEPEAYKTAPVLGTDYTLELNIDDELKIGDWIKGADGYYYHKAPVDTSGATADLISNYTITNETFGDYELTIEVLASAVQASPEDAVNDAWGATVASDGTLVPPGGNN